MRAVFLDRDGCLNLEWLNPTTGQWESPMAASDLSLIPGAIEALLSLQARGFALFLVSNQPSFAKGKCSLEDLRAVHARFAALVEDAGVRFREYYYSYHHPDGVVAGYSGPSPDRKPSPHFLNLAAQRHGVDLSQSWVIGDRDSDAQFGRNGGARTIQVANPHSVRHSPSASPDYWAEDVLAASRIIANHNIQADHEFAR